ncbi:hypothetical protein [Oscillatoria sp. FACHB-1406]|uniref:hypothetical protein n=1 Tax=Oscillatoria sp. FACHB-1406 TaxID=2692846 RepID=UPI0016853BF8|nr:hypothetical protein [Oscillatoria sp. FACHB-1406]MBD2580305.1 hypothetical protein [Oscillatoria sp. FACHB-1406]
MTSLDYKQQAASWQAEPFPEADSPLPPPASAEVAAHSMPAVRSILDCRFTQTLEQEYGPHWERMEKYSKYTFRAALSLYVFWSQWLAAERPEDLMAEAIEQTNSDLRLDDPAIYEALAACIEFSLQDLERLLLAIGAQIAEGCWSPNS